MKQIINIILENVKKCLENLEDPKAFIEYLNNIQDFYKNIEDTTQIENIVLIVFHDMIADMISQGKND